MTGQDQYLEEILVIKEKLNDMYVQHFLEKELFSPVWWLSVGLIIFPVIIWWKVLDKKRLLEILFFGLLVKTIATFLDIILSDHMMWEYPVRIIPQCDLLLPVDYIIIPVIGMIIYQKCATWRKFLLVSTAASAVLSFLGEPFAEYIGMYKLLTWRHYYSFPIYIAIFAFIRFVTIKAVAKNNAAR